MRDINILKSNDIDVDSGLEILGDIEMYDDTLNDFILECEGRLPKLVEYKNNNDLENYAILVHAIKGDSKYLGFSKLADMALEHQLKSQANDMDYVNNNYDDLISEINRVMLVVKKYLNSNN